MRLPCSLQPCSIPPVFPRREEPPFLHDHHDGHVRFLHSFRFDHYLISILQACNRHQLDPLDTCYVALRTHMDIPEKMHDEGVGSTPFKRQSYECRILASHRTALMIYQYDKGNARLSVSGQCLLGGHDLGTIKKCSNDLFVA
mgnify:CR=1 FL=1